MKKSQLALALSAAVLFGFTAQAVELKSNADRYSYAIGVDMGKSVKDINADGANIIIDVLQAGLLDGAKGSELAMSEEEMQTALQEFSQERMLAMKAKMEAEIAKAKEASEKFLNENKAKEGVKVTASGLQYKTIKEGEGAQPGPYDSVEVKYTGKVSDGTVFDSSESHGGSANFKLNQVIEGWREGLQLMKEGGHSELVVPPELAYGDRPAGGIPPHAVLVFDVELLKVIPNPNAEAEKAEEEKRRAEVAKALEEQKAQLAGQVQQAQAAEPKASGETAAAPAEQAAPAEGKAAAAESKAAQ